jgi:hypothetical protein
MVLLFYKFNNESLIVTVFELAGLTYGPLLGLYAMGLLTSIKPNDIFVPVIALASPVLSYILKSNSKAWLNGYEIGFEILIINGLITFILLFISSFFNSSRVEAIDQNS